MVDQKKKNITKTITYGPNILAGALGRSIQKINYDRLGATSKEAINPDLANPIWALSLWGADLIADNVAGIKNSSIYGLGKLGTLAYFGIKSFGGVVNLINGNYENIEDLPFD